MVAVNQFTLRRARLLQLALLLLVCKIDKFGVCAAAKSPETFDGFAKGESWTLVQVENQPVQTIEGLSSGVYSLELASARATACGGPRSGTHCSSLPHLHNKN